MNEQNLENKIFEQEKVKAPSIDTEKAEVTIDEITADFNRGPKEFIPGHKYERVIFKLPINQFVLFMSLLEMHIKFNSDLFVEHDKICYYEIPGKKITGNNKLQDEIKERAKRKFNGIQNLLSDFEKKASQFNNEELKPYIQKLIKSERKKRKDIDDSISNMNPF